ncbi:unnamed protein product [Amaranthus hypochondriacus]
MSQAQYASISSISSVLESFKYQRLHNLPNFTCRQIVILASNTSNDDCPLLEERCNVGCENWHKIEHVPNILINMYDVRFKHEDDSSSDGSGDYEDLNGQIQLHDHYYSDGWFLDLAAFSPIFW